MKGRPDVVNAMDMGKAATSNLDSVFQQANAGISQGLAVQQNYMTAMKNSMPKENMFAHAEQLKKLNETDLIIMAKQILKEEAASMNMVEKNMADKIAADTSMNTAGTGALLLATGASVSTAVYLICKGILKDPHDRWAVNDLGVYFRDKMDYARSLQCYFCAYNMDTAQSAAINTNIGWASAYFGDFTSAKKYFEQALSIDGNFSSAIEGEALLAYQRGDIAALFQCLAKEIKYLGAGSNGPSDAFAGLCGGISTENTGSTDKQTEDPSNDHTYDNADPDQENSQDPPPGADVNDISYPRFRKVFVGDPTLIAGAIAEGDLQAQQAMGDIKRRTQDLAQRFRTLKPLVQTPYTDDEGNLIIPNSFKKYVDLLVPIQESFEKRMAWCEMKLEEKLNPLRTDVINRDADMLEEYNKANLACIKLRGNAEDNCKNEVNCTWLPKMYRSKNNDLEVVIKLWNDYYDYASQAIKWYIDASAPFISRVHDQGWNDYLNRRRELEVRKAIIHAYGLWGSCLGDILTPMMVLVRKDAPACARIDINGMEPPDPFYKKPKHLNTFAGPCYKENTSVDFLVGSYESNCEHTKWIVGVGPVKQFWEHVYDPHIKERDYDRRGAIIGVSKSIGFEQNVGNHLTMHAAAEAGATVTLWNQFDSNGQFTGKGADVEVTGDVGAGVTVKAAHTSTDLGQTWGVKGNATVKLVAGSLDVSNVSGEITH